LKNNIVKMAQEAKKAGRILTHLSSQKKEEVLLLMAHLIKKNGERIKEENEKDLKEAQEKKLSPALIDRLTLSNSRISKISISLREIAQMEDPIGKIEKMRRRPNGLLIGKMTVPLGVIGIIYEARPNVTADAAALCLKSGNSVILRGGSEALNSNIVLTDLLQEALYQSDLPQTSIQLIRTTDHQTVMEMLKLNEYIDVIIPRGGEGLIRTVTENSTIPVIKHYQGVCHIYVDSNANLRMAEEICFNAKVQRPGVCNAMETLLVNEKIAGEFLPLMIKRFKEAGVEIRGDEISQRIVPKITLASQEDWYTEYLDLILSLKVVRGIEEAIEHINHYGSGHSDAIVTESYSQAGKFLNEVDSAAVYVNASTRFTDGGEFGLGAEIGISTQKLHARGPMGAAELTSRKFIIFGQGQIRK